MTDTAIQEKKYKRPSGKYTYAVGRRKQAVARVYLYANGNGEFTVNGKASEEYFRHVKWQDTVNGPMEEINMSKDFNIWVLVSGGGVNGQAEAIRLGIARALEKTDGDLRGPLKAKGYLSRDARVKERKKPGLKRARRSPQWSKR